MEMSSALVSIIIPYYNKKDTILRSVNSVIAQTYSNWELIIIDDCGENRIEKNTLPQDDRIRVLFNESNKGVALTRQRGLENSKGEYIAFLDADDWWDDFFLISCLETLVNNKESDGAYVQTFVMDNDGSTKLRRYCDRGFSNIKETLVQYAKPWQTSGILWRKANCGNWGKLKVHEDSWFEFSSSKTNVLLPVDVALNYYDKSGENHLSFYNDRANSTKDQQELFLMVEKNYWQKLNLKFRIVLINRLLRGQLKILECCTDSDALKYKNKLQQQQYFLGLISNSRFLLKVIHKVLQNSPYKIHF
jgi:glycosyltransferase involved in cell wall biosynthesis